MTDFVSLINQFSANLPPEYKFHPRQMDTAKAIYSESVKQGIDPRFGLAIGFQETGLGGNGKEAIFKSGIDNDKGRGHAYGFMQVLKGTAAEVGMLNEWEQAKNQYEKTKEGDPEVSAKIGVAYLKRLSDKYGATNIADLSAAYYGGPGRLGTQFSPQITKYVKEVTANMGKFGDGRPVAWKQSGLLQDGQFSQLAAADAAPSQIQPASSSPFTQPMSTPSPMQASSQYLTPNKQAASMVDLAMADTSSNRSRPNPASETDPFGSAIDSLLPASRFLTRFSPLAYQADELQQQKEPDPIDQLRTMVSNIYDDVTGEQNG